MIETLANKYRPLVFRDVLGQGHIVKVLRKHIDTGQIRPAYLFAGQFGSGKTTLARIFARALLCRNPVDGDPCNVCDACQAFLSDRNPNFKEVDAATTGLVDDVRKIKEEALYSPFQAKFKVLLMDESQRMTMPAQSALLKFLEEGVRNFVVMFATTDPDKMLPAIRSRCLGLGIVRIAPTQITDRLHFICDHEEIEAEPEGLELITSFTNGHVRDAIMLLDQIKVLGPVSKKAVAEFLQLDLQNAYFEMLRNLAEKPDISFKLLAEVLGKVDATRVARGIADVALMAYSFGQGVRVQAMSLEATECKKLHDQFGEELLVIVDRFSDPIEFNDSLLYCKLFQTRLAVFVGAVQESEQDSAFQNSDKMMELNLRRNRARRAKLGISDKEEELPSPERVFEVLSMGVIPRESDVGSISVGAPSGKNSNISGT